MNLIDFCGNDVKIQLHKEKEIKIEILKNKNIEKGFSQEESLAKAEMDILIPEKIEMPILNNNKKQDYKEIKFYLTNQDFELLKKYVSVREYAGTNIGNEIIISILNLLEQGFLKMEGKEVVINGEGSEF